MTGANAASRSNKRGLRSVFIHLLPLERSFLTSTIPPSGPLRECQKVILSLTQRVESILRLLNAADMSLRIELARLRRIAARSVRLPCGKNDGIIRFREHEACLCAAGLGRALELYPRLAYISLAEQPVGTRHQPGRFRTALRLRSSRLLRRSCLRGLFHLVDRAVRRAFERNAHTERMPRGFKTLRRR